MKKGFNKPYKVIEQENGSIRIYGNNHLHDMLYWSELTTKEHKEFDWISEENQDYVEFFRYKGNTYCMSEFMSAHNSIYNPNQPDWMKEFDGYTNDSFFSGILVKYPKEDEMIDQEHILVYTFIS
jgi:hypothetical protein